MTERKTGLGRGLSALMSDAGLVDKSDKAIKPEATKINALEPVNLTVPTEPRPEPTPKKATIKDDGSKLSAVTTVAISRLVRNPNQPRKQFETDKLDDLIASIQQKGILQPVLVRSITNHQDGDYQIVAGERRWRAALKAGLTSIPIIIRDLSDRDVLEIGVIENVQRTDLNPLEEALAYEKLIKEFGRTQAEIATTIGKSRVHVANTIRLTGLTERGRDLLMEGQITAGHARTLLAAKDPDTLAQAIIDNNWSVRDAERWVKAEKNPTTPTVSKSEKSTDILALEQKIRDTIGFAADIRHKARGGEIRLKYKDLDHMEALLNRLGLIHR